MLVRVTARHAATASARVESHRDRAALQIGQAVWTLRDAGFRVLQLDGHRSDL